MGKKKAIRIVAPDRPLCPGRVSQGEMGWTGGRSITTILVPLYGLLKELSGTKWK